jgi:hypothetical protein
VLQNYIGEQGCQMVCFQSKNPNLGKFWRVLQRYILWTFGIVRGNLAYFFPFWYFVPRKIWQPCWRVTLRREPSKNNQEKTFPKTLIRH